MTFNQIILKNLRQNIKNYMLYLFSLILSIVLYYSFVTLQYTKSINNENAGTIVQKGAMIGAIFLFIIIIIFLMYTNHLFIKRRTKEFALFQLIGLNKHNILRMLSIEQFTFFALTGIIGIFIGTFGSQLLLSILIRMMHLSINVSISFEPMALIQTMIMLLLAFIMIFLQNRRFLKKRSILDMMKDNISSEATKARITIPETVAGLLGIIMIAFGYYISTEMFGQFKALTLTMLSPFVILFLTIVGAYLFFRSSVSIIFKSLKKLKHGRINITDVVFTSSIMHRMKKNALSLTIIAIISAVTVTILCFGVISKSNTDYALKATSPQDINFSKASSAQKFEEQLKQKGIRYHKKEVSVLMTKIVKSEALKNKLNDTNNQLSLGIMPDQKVHGNKATLTNLKGPLSGIVNIHLNRNVTVKGQSQQTFNVNAINKDEVISMLASNGGPVLKVSPEKYQSLANDKLIATHYGYNIHTHQQLKQAEHIAQRVAPNVTIQSQTTTMLDQSNGILMFVSSFLGLAFLVAAGCIIYIKQMDETEDEMSNYRILRRIGFTHIDMMKGIGFKILFNFGLPLLIALLHALFAALAFMNLLGQQDLRPVIVVMVVYTIVYLIFAVISFIHANNKIKQALN